VIGGRPAVFISCSELYRERVADPLKATLDELGVHGVIVSEELRPVSRSWEPEFKVDSYLASSEAFVALVTPDDQLSDGTFRCRPNIVEEVGRVRNDPRLSRSMIVAKAPAVSLWSNINPTYDRLDVDRPDQAIDAIVAQLRAWEILPARHSEDVQTTPESRIAQPQISAGTLALLEGIGIADHDKAVRQTYATFLLLARSQQETILDELVRTALSAEDQTHQLVVCSVIEAIDRLDPTLVTIQTIETLTLSDSFSLRSSAAVLLWQWAEISPGRVPLAQLGRLARPISEDWYVQAPAMAAVKELMLRRPEARVIIDALIDSSDGDDRYAAARALLDVAQVSKLAVPRDLAERLALDPNENVAATGIELLRATDGVSDEDRWSYFHRFGL
jgi:hypothetical protein